MVDGAAEAHECEADTEVLALLVWGEEGGQEAGAEQPDIEAGGEGVRPGRPLEAERVVVTEQQQWLESVSVHLHQSATEQGMPTVRQIDLRPGLDPMDCPAHNQRSAQTSLQARIRVAAEDGHASDPDLDPRRDELPGRGSSPPAEAELFEGYQPIAVALNVEHRRLRGLRVLPVVRVGAVLRVDRGWGRVDTGGILRFRGQGLVGASQCQRSQQGDDQKTPSWMFQVM